MSEPDGDLTHAVRTVIRLARIAQQACDEAGLTLPQYRALNSMVRGPQRAFELAGYSAVSRPAMSALTTGLERQGWAARTTAPGDGRGVSFIATDAGLERLSEADRLLRERFEAVLGGAAQALLALDTVGITEALDRQAERDFPTGADAPAAARGGAGATGFDPSDPEVRQCPHPHYERMRADEPVCWVPSSQEYLVTRHDLVLEVLRDPATFSSRRTRALMPLTREELARVKAAQDEGHPRLPILIAADAPDHTRHRRLVSKAFSPRTVAAREDAVRTITTRLIDAWIDQEQIELVRDFAVPLPVEVIADALNVPHELMGDFKRWSDDAIVGFGDNATIDQLVEAERGINELQRHLEVELDARREQPQADLLTSLLDARIDDDDPEVTDTRPLETAEILGVVQQLIVGGNETTTKALAALMRDLAENPEQWDAIKRDPSRIPTVIEESLRLSSPVQGFHRTATRDVELGGVTIAKGAKLVVTYASANRDEALFEDPDAFTPDRPALMDHVAFGKGPHFCLGAGLARLELRVALEELSRRLASYALNDRNDYRHNESFLLRGLLELHLEIVRA